MKLGVFLPNWIGDAVMATPTLRALRKRFPGVPVTGVMRPYIADALAGAGLLDDVLLYDPKKNDPNLSSGRLIRELRGRRLDMTLLLPNSFRTALLAWLGGCRHRVGYNAYLRSPLLNKGLATPLDERGRPAKYAMVDYYLELAYAVGCPRESHWLDLAVSPADEVAAAQVWKKLGLREGRVVTINSSGAFGASKLWPPEYFAELARRLAATLDCDALVLCGPSERAIAQKIVHEANHPRVKSLADEPLSIGLSKACVRRSRLMVSTDSGPRHFAVAFGVPLVCLFGPTPPIWGRNSTACETQLMLDDLECFGCHRRTCPLGHHQCMRGLTVDRVFTAVAERWRQANRRLAA